MSRKNSFNVLSQKVAYFSGHPATFFSALGIVILWAVTGPIFGFNDTWQLVINTGTTIITFLMVFVIQNSQNRDAAAIQAKLDEIIRALGEARNDFIGVEHLTDRQLEHLLDQFEREYGKQAPEIATQRGLRRRLLDGWGK